MLVDVSPLPAAKSGRSADAGRTDQRSPARAGAPLAAAMEDDVQKIARDAQRMRSLADGAGPYDGSVEDINRAVVHLAEIVRLLTGQHGPAQDDQVPSFSLNETMPAILRLARPMAEARRIAVELVGFDELLPAARGVQRLAQQILLNLLSNALKFSPEGSTIVIGVNAGDALRISVSDAGPGVPDDQRELIFEPFEQAQSSQPGMGLGLALSRRYAEQIGGRLYLAQQQPRGATFILELQRA